MIICIDFDDTYTRDPAMWDQCIAIWKKSGCDVWCVSARAEEHMAEVRGALQHMLPPEKCVGTDMQAKRAYLFYNHGVYGDIWIDDNPAWVDHGVAPVSMDASQVDMST